MMQKHILLSCCVVEEQDSYFTSIFRGGAENHRMVWVRRGLKDHLIPIPCCTQGHLPRGQVVQSPIQPGHFQGCCVSAQCDFR